MKGKKIIILVVLLIILVGVIFIFTSINKSRNEEILNQQEVGEFVLLRKDGTKENISEKLNEIKVVEGLEISEIELTEKDNVSQISATVENSTEDVVEGMEIDIIFLNKDGSTMEEISGYIRELQPGEITSLYASVIADVSNAYDVYVVKK